MWIREPINIELTRNSASPIGLQFWDEAAGTPLDVSGYGFQCKVGKSEGADALASFNCTITDALLGAVDILFDGQVFANQAGPQEVDTFAYQVLATIGGVTVTAMRGSIILTPGVN